MCTRTLVKLDPEVVLDVEFLSEVVLMKLRAYDVLQRETE